MKKFSRRVISVAASLAALSVPMFVHAESAVNTGAGTPLTASARLDFSVVVPKFVSLRIGAAGAGITAITFTVPGQNVGDGTAAAVVGGDLGAGVVTAAVRGNNGNITLTSNTSGAMNDGNAAETLSFTQITTATALNTSATALAAPPLGDGPAGVGSVTVTATNKIVDSDARWTYSYLNTVLPPAGTYGGVNANNGRVTYTASMP